jgi:polynucleotide 5'-kinase involved in rRNA processing
MKCLIILRGPAGSGKTSVSRSITELVWKDNACILDLDITHPQEGKFNQNL